MFVLHRCAKRDVFTLAAQQPFNLVVRRRFDHRVIILLELLLGRFGLSEDSVRPVSRGQRFNHDLLQTANDSVRLGGRLALDHQQLLQVSGVAAEVVS